ncbi:YqhR family membrane protein [Ferdinandcohnia quinoae]|uniref:YqhR family membrane protein n=1 Tax=Fredinandcohnia quinoae TaxID=2918902 RepID=A0AAW5E130_9BACI|nr:YqhR family membrane protein [Fredinandcohnia sp. SECRCQ15]MCH1626611.1 YqhR family membrane protein [Fredinandcohnia sp. SECRCQ15]
MGRQSRESPSSFLGKVVTIGLVGGIFWSLLSYVSYILNFTEISPNLVLQPWLIGEWKNRVLGQFIGILVIGIISIGVALMYYALLKRFQSIWIGMIYGIVLWAIVFYVLNPIFPDLKTVGQLDMNTLITTICFYILYGVFIGYSISFEANEISRLKTETASNE